VETIARNSDSPLFSSSAVKPWAQVAGDTRAPQPADEEAEKRRVVVAIVWA
jgi:hypothetical protein